MRKAAAGPAQSESLAQAFARVEARSAGGKQRSHSCRRGPNSPPMPSMARIVTDGLTTAPCSYALAPGVYLAAGISNGILAGPASASCRLDSHWT